MPVNRQYPQLTDQSHQDVSQTQATKYCSHCSCPLTVDSINTVFLAEDHDSNIVCAACTGRLLATRSENPQGIYVEPGLPAARTALPATRPNTFPSTHSPSMFEDDIEMDLHPASNPASSASLTPPTPIYTPPYLSPPSPASEHPALSIRTGAASSRSFNPQQHATSGINDRGHPNYVQVSLPDPCTDITRLRVRPQGHHCLYPGATFQGTQKSGRNSYDVNVTIVDVDFSSSFLCGYLCIRGLTEDWPELTTYFDAEIIGSRYGFLTQKWGANEQEDMVHWQRFPAFRHVKNELKKPHLTMPDRDRGAVFMRWKERFLVPDHRVQDINGASFAGFYYVCVDFNPSSPATSLQSVAQSVPLRTEGNGDVSSPTSVSPGKFDSIPAGRRRRDSSVRRGGRGSSIGPRSSPPAATMSGFYFHQNSEPYQQLSLSHIPERSSSCFEYR
ncbi:vacuolar import and degradation protein-domain-containing protein [Phlebopus sp. FC_14]|nr:vacuolar import and degradation protein-domain-containing protein [Phlebopus sp. FC_14]